MVNLDLFNDESEVSINRFGGPFNDDDPTGGIYLVLGRFHGFVYYSCHSADKLLTAVNDATNINLTESKNYGPGYMSVAMPHGRIHWILFDGPQGSALACFVESSDGKFIQTSDPFNLASGDAVNRMPLDIRMSPLGDGMTATGAAAAIGMGSVIAPWYVPGFEQTHEPDPTGDRMTDGHSVGLMSAELIHALATWQQVAYDTYQKPYATVDGNDVNIIVMGVVEHDGQGPKLLFPISPMTEQELTAAWGGIDRFGPCRPYLFAGIGTMMCDLDPHASAEQVDACAHELLATVDRWLHRNDSSPSAEPASTSTKCGNCGAVCKDGDMFCSSCGAPVEAPRKTETRTPNTCPVCGRTLGSDEAFCGGCGTRIPSVMAPQASPSQPSSNNPTQTMTQSSSFGGTSQGSGPESFPGGVSGHPGTSDAQPGMAAGATVQGKTPTLTIALIAALIVVVVFVAVLLSGGKGNLIGGTTASEQGSSSSSSSSSSSGGSSTCSTAPKATVATIDTMNDYLVATVHFSSSCSGSSKDVFGSNNTEIKLSDSDGLVASAVFDFSADPVDISSSAAQARLAFATNQYWRVPEQIDATDLTVTVSSASAADGSASAPASGVMAGANAMSNDDRESAAHQALETQISHDKSAASGFYYTYTTQLSSKRLNLDAEGKVWSYQDIWAEYLGFKSRYPNALLIWSNDYPTYTKKGPSEYYVTLSGESFSSTDDATSWCSANGYDSDHCLPVDLS